MTRDVRRVLFKAGKTIGNGNIRAAELQHDNDRLRAQIQMLSHSKMRKRVIVNPNERFANTVAIKVALDAVKRAEKQTPSTAQETEAKRVAQAAADASMEEMCFNWELVSYMQ